MKKIKKEIRIYFCIALASSILFVVGIPLIPIFAGKNWFIASMGIIFTVFGFYGMPFLWLKYGSLFKIKRIICAVEEEHLLSNVEIALQMQITEQEVKNLIVKALNKKYICGYVYDGLRLALNPHKKPAYKIEVNTCGNCSARLEVDEDKIYCPYCGTIYTKLIHK